METAGAFPPCHMPHPGMELYPANLELGMISPYSAHSPPLRAAMPMLLGRGEVSHIKREIEARG